MFTAKLEDGTTISVADPWHLDELKHLRKEKNFYCPLCREHVKLKLGTKRQWHFAHSANSNCEYVYKRETMYHLKGKKQLYDWFKEQAVDVALEVYLPLIKQRPDLLLRYDGKLYAIEYQCTPIEPHLLIKRTKGYKQIGITPLWILGGNRLKRHSATTFSLKTFEWLTTRQTEQLGHTVTYYCPEQRSFVFLEQLTPYTQTRLIAAYDEQSLKTCQVDELLHRKKKKNVPFDYWLTVKKYWRYRSTPLYPTKTDLFMQQILYRRQVPLQLFPIEAGWPADNHYVIETPPYYWQTFLLLECIEYQLLHHSFSGRIVKKCLQPYIHHQLFTQRQTPNEPDWSIAVDGFLQTLCHLNYLEKEGPDLYKRKRKVTLPFSTDKAVELDRHYFYNKFIPKHQKGIYHTKANV